MPRGRGPRHKGAKRQFTDEDTLARDVQEIRLGVPVTRRNPKDADGDSEKDSDEEKGSDEGEEGEEQAKPRGADQLLETDNPNRAPVVTKSVKKGAEGAAAPELSRREREELQRQRDKETYERLHAQHKTAEAQADLARLAIVRAQREEAARKREAERSAKETEKAEAAPAPAAATAAPAAAAPSAAAVRPAAVVGRGGRSRARKEREKEKKAAAATGGAAATATGGAPTTEDQDSS